MRRKQNRKPGFEASQVAWWLYSRWSENWQLKMIQLISGLISHLSSQVLKKSYGPFPQALSFHSEFFSKATRQNQEWKALVSQTT